MAGDLVSWVFYSPRRLAVVGVVALLAVLGLGGLLTRLSGNAAATSAGAAAVPDPTGRPAAGTPGGVTGPDGTAGPAPAASGAPSGTGTGPTSVGVQVPDTSPFVTAAVRFVGEWGALKPGETAGQWHDRVDPLVTAELAAALRLTDPSSLPDATPQGNPQVRFVSQSSALVAVPLSNGTSVLVTVVSLGADWQIADVQPDVGDTGNDSGATITPTTAPTATPTARSTARSTAGSTSRDTSGRATTRSTP